MTRASADPPFRIGVIGAGEADPRSEARAREVGRAVALAGAVLVCGGRGGVMAAAARGAHEAGGLVLGLLPGTEPSEGNAWLTLPIATGLGEARNVLVVRAAEAIVSIGGAWGTLSEIALAGKLGRPLIVLDPPEAGGLGLPRAGGPAEAVDWALGRARSGRENPTP